MDNGKHNVFDYLAWRGDISFESNGFNEIDSLIFSIFSYLNFSFIGFSKIASLREAAEIISSLPDEAKFRGPGFIMGFVLRLLEQAAKTERFQKVNLTGYVDIIDEEKEMQFAAITFLLPDSTGVISYRGTDTTLVGWKEDLNMSIISGIPSQIEAAKYSVEIMNRYHTQFRLTGHSKGGNLAIWAAAHLPLKLKSNLLSIYSNDGPGFSDDFLESDNYKEVREKIHSYVPESSIVGVLMSHDEFITISSSSASVLQHDPFTWNVIGKKFIYSNTRTLSSRQMERVINSWIKSMSASEREQFIESVFDLLGSSNAKTLEDLDKGKIKSIFSMQKTFREMGIKKQMQLIMSLSKVIFNNDILTNSNLLTLLFDNTAAITNFNVEAVAADR